MNAHTKALKIADEAGAPQNVASIEQQLARHNAATSAFKAAAYQPSPAVVKTRAHIDGTAYTHQRILRRETIETALRYRAARVLGHRDMMRAHAMALRSLNRVRREMRDAYPSAKPFWESADILSGVRHD